MGQGKSSMSDMSSTSDSDYETKKSLEGDGQVANSERFHWRIIIFVDSLSVAGERPETLYSTIAVPAMKCANILELASLYGRMLVPLDLVLEIGLSRTATCRRRLLQAKFLSGVSS